MNESGEYFLFYISEHRSRRSVAPKLRMSNSDVRYAVEEFPALALHVHERVGEAAS